MFNLEFIFYGFSLKISGNSTEYICEIGGQNWRTKFEKSTISEPLLCCQRNLTSELFANPYKNCAENKMQRKRYILLLNSRKEMYSKYIFVRDKIIKEKIIALCHINEVWVRNCHD